MKGEEVVVYGRHAALALATHRPSAVRRVLFGASARDWLGPLAGLGGAREVADEQLARAAGTLHHEGIAVTADPLRHCRLADLLERARGGVLVALDEVGNPHNLGAILRSAAYFGVRGVIVPTTSRQATLSPAAMRVSQGGAEVVPVAGVERMDVALRRLQREGFAVAAADVRGGERADALRAPACVVLGNEGVGLDERVLAACDRRVHIAGTGAVESLNVSVAVGILLAGLFRA